MHTVLEGVRVLDFGRYIAGPFCAAILADLGANVIRVEPVGGADDRFLMPATHLGEGAMYIQSNRNKRAVTLALGTQKGRRIQERLIKQADVVVCNFSPDAARHFGLDYETLKALKPDIVLTSISAFSSVGPLRGKVGFDGIGQAVSGAIYLSGEPGQPYRAASSYIDFSTALSASAGTLAALIRKMKTGEGQHVEASLVSTGLNITNPIIIEEYTGINHREPTGNRSPIAGPSDIFRASDGWFIMQVVGQGMFKRWCELVGRCDLGDDPRFANDILRGKNGAELSMIMQSWCQSRTVGDCLQCLAQLNIAASPLLSPAEIVNGALGLFDSFLKVSSYPGTAGVPIARTPFQFAGEQDPELRPPPTLGQHNDDVYAEFGFSADEISLLRSENVI